MARGEKLRTGSYVLTMSNAVPVSTLATPMTKIDAADCHFTVEVFADWLYTGKLSSSNTEWNREEHYDSDQWYATAKVNMLKA